MKKKIAFFGKHSHRTPLSYPDFQHLFTNHLEFIENPEKADFLVTGFVIDFRDNADFLLSLRKKNPGIKFVVVSEEPLWDTLWSGNYLSRNTKIRHEQDSFDCHVLNHCTSTIFNFNKFPYFILTRDDFFVRYANLYRRNAQLSGIEILAIWKEAKIRRAFYAEKRETMNFEVKNVEHDILGLSVFRTQLASQSKGLGLVRVGQNWGDVVRRQSLPDWHLDKLAALDRHSFVVSALENTHHHFYVTEKIFDAYAVLGIPLYAASERHAVSRLVPGDSFINLYGLTPEEADEKINAFEPNGAFVDSYRQAQARLAELFCDSSGYWSERKCVASAVVKEFQQID